jgi:hypothetical protein
MPGGRPKMPAHDSVPLEFDVKQNFPVTSPLRAAWLRNLPTEPRL